MTSSLNPLRLIRSIRGHLDQRKVANEEARLLKDPNWRGVMAYPPGHFYSPLLDIESFPPGSSNFPFDGEECWENIDLRLAQQQSYYTELLNNTTLPCWRRLKISEYRYYTKNTCFIYADAFTLSGIIQMENPARIIEVGSGFSSAVILDTLDHANKACKLTFIEPYPERLYSLLKPDDLQKFEIHQTIVQSLPVSIFDQLEAQDILFIDSSHVAKVGSDVTFLFLRILPRLKEGVLIHIHDIFYPFTYHSSWIRQGWAWNESLFLRALLIGNPSFEVIAFNCCAGYFFPDIFQEKLPEFLDNTGGSIWLRKVR